MKVRVEHCLNAQMIFELLVLFQVAEYKHTKKNFIQYAKNQLAGSGYNFAGIGENGFDIYSPIETGNAKLLFMKWFKEYNLKDVEIW